MTRITTDVLLSFGYSELGSVSSAQPALADFQEAVAKARARLAA